MPFLFQENGHITKEGITLTISEQEGGSGVRVHVYFKELFCTDGGVYKFQVGNETYKTVYNVKSMLIYILFLKKMHNYRILGL